MPNNKNLYLVLASMADIGELSCEEGHESTWNPYTEKYFCLCIDEKFSKDSEEIKEHKNKFDRLVVDAFKREKH